MMKTIYYRFTIIIVLIFLFVQCKKTENIKRVKLNQTIQELIFNLNNSEGSDVMVIAHRGDWRNAPENSLQAIKNCIDLGVDIVEIDVRKTKDSQLVVIHDRTLDRTTTGKGRVVDWTLDSLKTLRLVKGIGVPSNHKIPTLKEALLSGKGKILFNLDKCYNYFDEAYKIIQETGTSNQVIIKGFDKTVEEVKNDFRSKLDSIIFMPVINLDKQKNPEVIINNYQKGIKPVAFEFVFSNETSDVLNNFSKIKQNGSRIWVNSLWGSLNANHGDDMAVMKIDSIYGWYLKKGVNMIQTDRPELLLKYLRSKGLHD